MAASTASRSRGAESVPRGIGTAPANARVVLGTLILVAAVANLNLSVANVALPSIGKSFDSSQTMLDLIAVGFLDGDRYAYLAGLVALVIGGALVFLRFPERDEEERIRAAYHAQDEGAAASAPPMAGGTPVPAAPPVAGGIG